RPPKSRLSFRYRKLRKNSAAHVSLSRFQLPNSETTYLFWLSPVPEFSGFREQSSVRREPRRQ
ncbi:MAG TPA: hypothetical protein PKW21_12275, partial [Rhabdaerophilum sp.]|nr:hypothetical protein [Rhabdaerophilum sp.]